MPFENNGNLQKWHMRNTPSKIDKYDTTKNGALQNCTPCQKMPKDYLPRAELSDFLNGILKFLVCFRPMVMGF